MPDGIWRQIEVLLEGARSRVVLVAPFIKVPIFRAALAAIPSEVTDVKCITRWSAEEVAAGVSDPEIFDAAGADGRPTLLLCHSLHAKLYVSDGRCLVGSANLTGKATGKAQPANIELLVEADADHVEVAALLRQLLAESTPATPEIAASVRAQAKLLVANHLAPILVEAENDATARWYPATRAPERLYRVYLGDPSGCPAAVLEGALGDLAHLDLPPGLDMKQFDAAVLQRVYSFPEVAPLIGSGRISSVELEAALLANGAGTAVDAAERALTLTRWLMFFDADLRTVPAGPYDIVRGRQLD